MFPMYLGEQALTTWIFSTTTWLVEVKLEIYFKILTSGDCERNFQLFS